MVSNGRKSVWTKCKRRKIVLYKSWDDQKVFSICLEIFPCRKLDQHQSWAQLWQAQAAQLAIFRLRSPKLRLPRNDCWNSWSKWCWPSLGNWLLAMYHSWMSRVVAAGRRSSQAVCVASASVPSPPPVTSLHSPHPPCHSLSQTFLMLTSRPMLLMSANG